MSFRTDRFNRQRTQLTWVILADALLDLPVVEAVPQEVHFNGAALAKDDLRGLLQELPHQPCVGVEVVQAVPQVWHTSHDSLKPMGVPHIGKERLHHHIYPSSMSSAG